MKAKKSFIWLGILLLATIWILVRKNNVPYHSINAVSYTHLTLPTILLV